MVPSERPPVLASTGPLLDRAFAAAVDGWSELVRSADSPTEAKTSLASWLGEEEDGSDR